MALNNFKTSEDNYDNDVQRLMCTTPGCKKRWSVKIEAPKCSFHQWGGVKDVGVKSQLPKLEAPIDTEAWWQK